MSADGAHAVFTAAGDLAEAKETHKAFFGLWKRFGLLPERYLLPSQDIHPTERYYPLRPELAESCYALHQATGSPRYLQMGADMVASLNAVARSRFAEASTASFCCLRCSSCLSPALSAALATTCSRFQSGRGVLASSTSPWRARSSCAMRRCSSRTSRLVQSTRSPRDSW